MKYFIEEECTRSDTAKAKGIDNTPSAEHKAHIKESIETSIIPEKINVSVSYFNGEELSLFPNIPPFKKRDCFSHSASENNIHNTYSAINNGIEFFDVLVNSPFYTRFSPQFRYALWVFCKSTSDISPDMSSAGQ
ncbi:hypothetical protein [Bacteroides fluxus]|jgi:hypothetical protein|uniref:Conserved domain protein n=1 Tax=Bacteroides fluxus YIT 12057 TaxID=763034 RepID=F3PYJ3_9BACE|nr:hypothetical protein [Bacteroides fluxus]EGF49953.1 conserved domain protein [Bacteroides fluxus YIT 12057]DAE76512.1 MAG TPA: hypothetical protein [Caudoviricetes sp.]